MLSGVTKACMHVKLCKTTYSNHVNVACGPAPTYSKSNLNDVIGIILNRKRLITGAATAQYVSESCP